MKIDLRGEELERYRRLKRERRLFGMLPMTDTSSGSVEVRIPESHLTPRQRMKLAEMEMEGFY